VGNRSYNWNYENQPTSITGPDSVTETYTYDADNERLTRSRSGVTTAYLAGSLWEEDSGGATRILYSFGGKVIAQRDSSSGGSVSYLHGDHLGSISLLTNQAGGLISQQEFDPWGKVRTSVSGSISQTSINYTGQRLDNGTGLLYYHSRYYDPGLGKFVSPDTIVPGMASGKGGDAATIRYSGKEELRGLTVDFHETTFVQDLHQENAFTVANGFWFQLNEKNQKRAKSFWGPANPQALNRYSYVLNNPLRYNDPTGHWTEGGDWNRGYKQQCTNGSGNRGDCSGDYNKPIDKYNGDGSVKAHLIRIFREEHGKMVEKYLWDDSKDFQDFQLAVGRYDASRDYLLGILIGIVSAAVPLIVSCFAPGVGTAICLAGAVGLALAFPFLIAALIRSVSDTVNVEDTYNRMKGIDPTGLI